MKGQELVKKVQDEFFNSGGALSLNFEEFCEFFKVEAPVARDLIKELCTNEWFQVMKIVDPSSGEESDRLQILPKYSRNFWVYSELVPTEAKAILEIGALLKNPLNSRIINLDQIEDQHLVKLIFQDQDLHTLPASIENFTRLKTLKIQRCKLASLPDTIGNLKNLQELDLDSNNLTVLPETIGKLRSLQVLWCRNNKLITLPKTLDSLKNLRVNPVPSPRIFSANEWKMKNLKKKINIRIWGSNPSEMKTMLDTLNARTWIPETTPIIGKNGETIRNEDINFSKSRSGLLEFFRYHWGAPKGLIYVIDLNDPVRLPKSRKYLSRGLEMIENYLVAIFVNKNDLIDCTEEELPNYLGIDKNMNRFISIFKINTVTGEGIREGIYWLLNSILDLTKKPEKGAKSENLLKICIIGSSRELQMQFVRRVAEDKSDVNWLPTLGANITTKKITIKETKIKLILVNTANQELLRKLRPDYFRGDSACIIVFDKSDRQSFDAVPNWLKEFRKYTPQPDIPVVLLSITTKEEEVSSDEGKAFAEQLELDFFETSSPTFDNSHEIFEHLAQKVIK